MSSSYVDSPFLSVAERYSIARMDQFIPSSVLEKLTYRERVVGRKKPRCSGPQLPPVKLRASESWCLITDSSW